MRSDSLKKVTRLLTICYKRLFVPRIKPTSSIRQIWKLSAGFFRWQLQSVRVVGLWILGLSVPATLPLHFPDEFNWMAGSISDIKQNLKELQVRVKHLVHEIEAIEAAEHKDYLTTKEFAYLVGLDPKTISNYASSGRIQNRKFVNGQWLIHKSEAEHYE